MGMQRSMRCQLYPKGIRMLKQARPNDIIFDGRPEMSAGLGGCACAKQAAAQQDTRKVVSNIVRSSNPPNNAFCL